jgi:F-type H+-transporting ATPase subunit b
MSARALGFLIIAVLVMAAPASAQEGGLLTPSTGLMFWTIVTFLIVLIVLWKAALPPILGAVEAREQQIRDLIEAAAKDRQDAQVALEQQNKVLEDTRTRVQEMVAEGRTAGERVREDIIAEARRQSEELLARARRDVRQELNHALEELKVEAVEIAIAAASKLVERNLDQEDNRRLVREYLADLDASSPARVPAGV